MKPLLLPVLCFLAGFLIAWLITLFVSNRHAARRIQEHDRLWEERLNAQQRLAEQAQHHAEEKVSELKDSYDQRMLELREQQEQTLHEQIGRLKAEMKTETETLLKAREDELVQGNSTHMHAILTPLKESIDRMQQAMDSNAREHLKSNTELRSQLEQAVRDMQERTSDIGSKADSLSLALTGKAKMQGCWGENLLDGILQREGLIKGMHYTREETNDDRTRPDFLFHFREEGCEKVLIVDSKVSLTAYTAYMNASEPKEKEQCLNEHVRSIRKHIAELAGKDYVRRVAPEQRFVDYVLMFMPIDMAFRTALDKEPTLWQEAYEKNVVIVTEQTVTPFLKIIALTWNRALQEDNNRELMKAAEEMIERVGQFYDSYRSLGDKLRIVCNEYNEGVKKLRENGHSITTSANKVVRMGIRREKNKKLGPPAQVLDFSGEKTTLQDVVPEEDDVQPGLLQTEGDADGVVVGNVGHAIVVADDMERADSE